MTFAKDQFNEKSFLAGGEEMHQKKRRRVASIRGHRVASALDLHQAIDRAKKEESRLAGKEEARSSPQSFWKDMPPEGVAYDPQQPVTKKLKAIIEENYYGTYFRDAIKDVSEQSIPELDQIKSLDQFYFYLDALVTWIPEIRSWDWDGEFLHERTVYLRITQFYYYFNHPLLEALLSPIAPVEGAKLSPISRWLRDFAVQWGEFLDTPPSSECLKSFKYAPEYAWQDFEKSPEEYATFNEYFAREFKDIDVQRPVASSDDDRVIVFPAESTFVGHWAISTAVGEPLPAPPSIVVKHIEWPINELLEGTEFARAFEGGMFCHTFLNTYDYHRLHTPVAGRVLEAKFIPGQVYLEVNLKEQGQETPDGNLARAVIPQRYLDAEDPTGYQFVQCRGLMTLESPIGKVAILPIGMAQVSSVVFVTPKADGSRPIRLTPEEKKKLDYNQQVELVNRKIHSALVGKELAKGEMFSFFQFGGSDFVMVFERRANVNVAAKRNVHYPIRSQFGVSNLNT